MIELEFRRTQFVLEKCNSVLSNLKTDDDKEIIGNYFTEYILIVFYREFEDKFKDIVKVKLKEGSTGEVLSFINHTMSTILKRIDKKDIEKTIGYFGVEKKNRFTSLVKESIYQKYKNFLTNRHNVAHSNTSFSISLEEVKDIHQVGKEMIKSISESLQA